jgi:hypothetical protein
MPNAFCHPSLPITLTRALSPKPTRTPTDLHTRLSRGLTLQCQRSHTLWQQEEP